MEIINFLKWWWKESDTEDKWIGLFILCFIASIPGCLILNIPFIGCIILSILCGICLTLFCIFLREFYLYWKNHWSAYKHRKIHGDR